MQQQDNILFRYHMDKEKMIRFQLLVYCYMMGMLQGKDKVSPTDIDCLTLIGIRGEAKLLDICNELVTYKVCNDVGYVRNIIARMQDKKLVCKRAAGGRDRNNKIVYLNPDIRIHVPKETGYVMTINYQEYATT